jgi:serine/threonine-protein kinase PRP4
MQVNITPERDLMAMLKKYGKTDNMKELQNFRDFLERCLALNPKDRITPQEAIEHPFLHFQTKL